MAGVVDDPLPCGCNHPAGEVHDGDISAWLDVLQGYLLPVYGEGE